MTRYWPPNHCMPTMAMTKMVNMVSRSTLKMVVDERNAFFWRSAPARAPHTVSLLV